MTHQSTTINFGSDSGNTSKEISLDDEYNRSVYALTDTDTKSTFLSTEIAYLKILPGASSKSYTLGSSSGTLSLVNSDILYDYEEDIDFIIEKSGELKFIPSGNVTYEWIGNDGGVPLFTNTLITLSSEFIGILRCSYQTLGDRLKLVGTSFSESEYEVLCVAYTGEDDKEYTSVNFDNGAVSTEVSLEVQVVDMCTGDPITDATVTIEGIGTGTTDSDGIFNPGVTVFTGISYDIRVTAVDYVDSDLDFIKNDSFSIPIVTDDEEE